MSYIYKITNDINNLVYIGQTIGSINARFKQHCYDSKWDTQNKFHRAMQEIGIEHFQVELIEECSEEELDKKERYWINYYNSYKNGYNSKNGGQNTLIKNNKDYCIQYYLENKDVKTLTQITKELGVGTNNLRELLQENNIRQKKKYQKFEDWSEEEKQNIIKDAKQGKSLNYLIEEYHHDVSLIKRLLEENHVEIKKTNNKIPILQIDKNTGKIIKEWDSVHSAKEYYGNKHISECILGKRKTAAGYKWIKKEG